jgi:hypothetical protein
MYLEHHGETGSVLLLAQAFSYIIGVVKIK